MDTLTIVYALTQVRVSVGGQGEVRKNRSSVVLLIMQ